MRAVYIGRAPGGRDNVLAGLQRPLSLVGASRKGDHMGHMLIQLACAGGAVGLGLLPVKLLAGRLAQREHLGEQHPHPHQHLPGCGCQSAPVYDSLRAHAQLWQSGNQKTERGCPDN